MSDFSTKDSERLPKEDRAHRDPPGRSSFQQGIGALLTTFAVVVLPLLAAELLAEGWLPRAGQEALRRNEIGAPWLVDDYFRAMGTRLADIEDPQEGHGPPSDANLAVALGRSSAEKDLDPKVLAPERNGTLQWAVLFGGGENIAGIVNTASLLAFLRTPPRLALVAIHPFMLAEDNCMTAEELRRLWEIKGQIEGHPESSSGWALVRNRVPLRRFIEATTFRLRRLIWWNLLGNLHALFSPAVDLAKVFPTFSADKGTSEWTGAIDLVFGASGYFREQCFLHPDRQRASLEALLQALQAGAGKVVVVLMPERSDFRPKTPPIAGRTVTGAVANSGSALLWDARSWLDDRAFFDQVHLNAKGRRAFSECIRDRVMALSGPVSAGGGGDLTLCPLNDSQTDR